MTRPAISGATARDASPTAEPAAPPGTDVIDDLLTLRDWLRYAVSRFNAANLVYGHGTATAIDEAAFLILSALELAPDTLEPWLDARLARAERRRCLDLIDARIATRKPAAYLIGRAYIKGYRFDVDERVIVPRSFIGELLIEQPDLVLGDVGRIGSILDLCTGSGCLAILAALACDDADVDAVDISADALAVARANIAGYQLADRVRVVESDLFAALGGRRYDLIVSNPPYVRAAAVAAFPPEYQAEPEMAHLGGEDGLDLVRRIVETAPLHLQPGGSLVVEVGGERDAVEHAYPGLPFVWLDTETSEGEVFLLHAADLPARSAPSPAPPTRRRPRS